MGGHTNYVKPDKPNTWNISPRLKTLSAIFMFIGVICLALTLFNDKSRAWHAYLVGLFYFTSLALGGLFFTAIQHVTNAGWSVNIRRIMESLTAFLPWAFGLTIIFIGGNFIAGMDVYDWFFKDRIAADHLLQHKEPYLNPTFFIIRTLLFFGGWMYLCKKIVGSSLKQDTSGDVSLTHKCVPLSIAFLLFFSLSYSLFSVDTLMSLEAHWFSTIFGVYAFAGLFQSTLCVMILIIAYLLKKGLINQYVNENHLHDLGKFLFGFVVFWAYIAFSQYMLIWYANLPEETIFFKPRQKDTWLLVSLGLIVFKFIVPFFALLPKWAKRNINHLVAVSILLLITQFVDLYWLVYPNLNTDHSFVFGFQDVGIFLGFLGLFMFAVMKFLSSHAVIPYNDPRIHESMSHEVVY